MPELRICPDCGVGHGLVSWPPECDNCGIVLRSGQRWTGSMDRRWDCVCAKHCLHLCHHCCPCKVPLEKCWGDP